MQMVHSRFNALLSACVLSLIATAGWSQSITWLGTLPGYDRSDAYGVSDNGVVVGLAQNAAGERRAFRWTAAGGMLDLGTLPGGTWSVAYGVSANGAVVVGESNGRAFRWENGVMQDLGGGRAYGVSANGAVVVGIGSHWRAFRWTASGGMQDLGTLGGYYSDAFGVSADGTVVVGWATDYYSTQRAFRWENGVMRDLGTLGGTWSVAYGVSANGAVVVGWAENAAERRYAFRWSGGMQDLGALGGYYSSSRANGVSADGTVVVGWSNNASQQPRAFRWACGSCGRMEDLNTTYASWLTNGSELNEARAISPDGRYIVGWGINAATGRREAFLLDTGPRCTALDGDVNGDGIVDDADLLIVLFNFGNRYR